MGSPLSISGRVVPGLLEPPGGKVTLSELTPSPLPAGIAAPPDGQASFGNMLGNALNSVNDLQVQSAQAQDALLHGEPVELHEVMIKAEQAGIAMDLLLEIRNKLLSAYNDIMRMPM